MNVLRLYFSATPSGDIHIACQSDRKNPIHKRDESTEVEKNSSFHAYAGMLFLLHSIKTFHPVQRQQADAGRGIGGGKLRRSHPAQYRRDPAGRNLERVDQPRRGKPGAFAALL